MSTDCINAKIREKVRCESLASVTPKPAKAAVRFTGEKITLNLDNVELRAILQTLADFTGLRIVSDPSVSGNATLRYKDVPWDQVLYELAVRYDLSMRTQGGAILVTKRQ